MRHVCNIVNYACVLTLASVFCQIANRRHYLIFFFFFTRYDMQVSIASANAYHMASLHWPFIKKNDLKLFSHPPDLCACILMAAVAGVRGLWVSVCNAYCWSVTGYVSSTGKERLVSSHAFSCPSLLPPSYTYLWLTGAAMAHIHQWLVYLKAILQVNCKYISINVYSWPLKKIII